MRAPGKRRAPPFDRDHVAVPPKARSDPATHSTEMRTPALLTTLLPSLLAVSLGTSACGFFHESGDDDHHHERYDDDDDDCSDDDVATPDAGATLVDAGVGRDAPAAPDAGACTRTYDCAHGQQCIGGACTPCANGVCTCSRDDDCAATELCGRASRTCETPPPECAARTTEAACSARTDCQPVYAGLECVDAQGGECQDGDTNCTCARFEFAACIVKP
jgi:hypothetical protein